MPNRWILSPMGRRVRNRAFSLQEHSKATSCTAGKKQAAVEPVEWDSRVPLHSRLEVVGDSALVINWLNVRWHFVHSGVPSKLRVVHDARSRVRRGHSGKRHSWKWQSVGGSCGFLAGRQLELHTVIARLALHASAAIL